MNTLRSSCLLFVLALATGCSDGRSDLVLIYPDQAALDQARWVDLFIGPGQSCAELQAADVAPRFSFDARGELPEIGVLSYGQNAFAAAVRDTDCRLYLTGCLERELRPRENATIRIALARASGERCTPGAACQEGRCVDADGGAVDAAVADAAADGGGRDAIGTDGAVLDRLIADQVRLDGAASDQAGTDLAAGVDSSSGPDAAAPDVATGDAATRDASNPPDGFVGRDQASSDATAGRDVVADSALPDRSDASADDRADAALPDQAASDLGIPLLCGNGTPNAGEQCDLGSANGNLALSCCTLRCQYALQHTTCGDMVCNECSGTSAICAATPPGPSAAGCNAPATECSGADQCDSTGGCLTLDFTSIVSCVDNSPLDCFAARCNGGGGCDQQMLLQPVATACQRPLLGQCDSIGACQWPESRDGLAATYFRSIDLTGSVLNRVDPVIDFLWITGAPDPLLPVDNFSVRWSGDVIPEFSETYTFYAGSDDGMRLWVDDRLLINAWWPRSYQESRADIDLIAGRRTSIILEYFEESGEALARLQWSSPSTPKQIIPQLRLHSTSSAQRIYLSDLPWTSASNGYGPVELDTSNGEDAAGDGAPLNVNGVTFAKGLGVHAASEISYDLADMNCSAFAAEVGVDAETMAFPESGSVRFEVWADGARLYQSAVMTKFDSPTAVHVDVAGRQQLRLVVTDGGDGVSSDHADWGDARVLCTDLVFNRRATASSEIAGFEPWRVVDGDAASGWASSANDSQWLMVDLGRSHDVNRVLLAWGSAAGRSYALQISENGSSWTDIYTTISGNGGFDDLGGLSGVGRYLRLYGAASIGGPGYALSQLWVFAEYVGPVCSNGVHDLGEACEGSPCCTAACTPLITGARPAGCNAVATVCSAADSCDGAGQCTSNDLPATTSCSDPDSQDCQQGRCDGAGTCRSAGAAIANGQNCMPPSNGRCQAGLCAAPGPSDLAAAYPFDEGTGTTVSDLSGNDNTGAISGASWTIAGRHGGALSFDGDGDFVVVPDSASLDVAGTGLTIMAWVWVDPSTPADSVVVGKPWTEGVMDYPYYQWGLEYQRSGIFWLGVGDSDTTLHGYSIPAFLSRWQHVAYTFDGVAVRGYLDGYEFDMWDASTALVARGAPLHIGADAAYGQRFIGRIDDLRIFDRALDAAEIAAARDTAVGP